MRWFILLVYVLVTVLSTSGLAMAEGDGAALFESMKCSMCHKSNKRAAAASLAEIAKTYQEKDKLVKFFKGETKPVIETEKWGMMRGQMSHLEALQEPEKAALADYILGFK
ncbi:MAG: c-type cytochrome [Syntrophobacter sp.]